MLSVRAVAGAVAARRRAAALQSGDFPDVPASDALTRHLASLALPVDADELAIYVPAAGLAVFGVSYLALGGLGGLASVVGVIAADVLLARSAPRRRAAATERALPLVLDGVARHLRAGGSLAQAIVATRPPASATDLGASWSRLADLVPLVGVTAALDEWSTSSPGTNRSLRLASAALSLAAETGGSPARAIDGVAATLRSRQAVADEIRALSSQSRASAAVIALAPLAFGLLAGVGDPRTRGFLSSPTGLVLLAVGVGLDGLGAWWMAHLCRPPRPAT